VLQVAICAVWLAVALEESRWFLVVCAAVALPIWVWHTIDVARADRRAALHREAAERPPR
jgi:L-asparagine transporter-like permease